MKKMFFFFLIIVLFLMGSCSKIEKGGVYSISSFSFPQKSICHQNFFGKIEDFTEENLDFQFKIVDGLAGNNSISFESVNFPDHYLRHVNFQLFLAPKEDSEVFKNDSSFFIRDGLSDKKYVSFESFNFPNHFIRHSSFVLFINENDFSDIFKGDATFELFKQ